MLLYHQHFINPYYKIPFGYLPQNKQLLTLFPMAKLNALYIIILLLFSLCISKSGGLRVERVKTQRFHSSSKGKRKLQNLVRELDETTYPITNPANFPPYTATPTIVTIPASNPTTPANPFPTVPPTTTVPAATTPTPITNPANPGNIPTTTPPYQPTNAPASSGQSWCIANTGASETSLQSALDYACGIGGADCSAIQDGGSCYDPNSLQNHASYAFNSYFQKNPQPTSCDFGGSAVLVNTNPSSGSCIYPSSGAATAMPLSTSPTTETPSSMIPPTTTSSSGTTGLPYGGPATGIYGSPPSLSDPSNPNSLFPSSFGPDSPPAGNSVPAGSAALHPHISLITLVAYFTGKLILGK